MNRHTKKLLLQGAFLAIVALLVVYTAFPFYWAVATSLTPEEKLGSIPVTYAPIPPSGSGYSRVLHNPIFVRSLVNSVIVAAGATVLALVIGSLGAFALARFRFVGRGAMLYLLLAMTMFPQIAVVGSLFQMVTTAGLYNTRLALVVTYLLLTLPFTVWILTSYFKSIPRELEEAAFVDGASPLQALWLVLLPIAMPGIVTTGLIAMIVTWNEYLFALSFTADEAARTVPVVVAQFTGETRYEIPWAQIMAGGIIATAPLVVLVYVFQRRIVGGLTAGAVKG
jgi:trehalose/maltose transport system permease protein